MCDDLIDDPSAFSSLDLYEVLQLDTSKIPAKDISPGAIKKAYRKLALQVHPDKARTEEQKKEFHTKFQEVAFAHSILIDPIKKKRYDTTGSLDNIPTEDGEESLGDFLKELFRNKMPEITEEMIEEDKKKYRKEEEYDSLLESYNKHKGDFEKIYEDILHTDDSNDKDFVRLHAMVQKSLDEKVLKEYKKFGDSEKARDKLFGEKTTKKGRKSKKKSEAEEAEELAKELGLKTGKGESTLKSLIAKRQQSRMADLVGSIEKKYSGKKQKGKRSHVDMEEFNEPSEEEFQRIQKKLSDNKNKKQKSKKWLRFLNYERIIYQYL